MNGSPIRLALVTGALVAAAAACGHKGPPQEPLRPQPSPVGNLAIERTGDAVTLRFVVPTGNHESNPKADPPPAAFVDQIDVFALTQPAEASRPTPGQLTIPPNLITTLPIRRDDPNAPGAKADARLGPGQTATYVDAVKLSAASTGVRYYVVVAAAGRRRVAAPILTVPLAGAPSAPADVKFTYTETTLTLSWSASTGFVLDETDVAGAHPTRIVTTPSPVIGQPSGLVSTDLPVEFGKPRCFVVRSVKATGPVSLFSEPSAPVCVTPVDRFPPPAPSALVPIPADGGGVDLSWAPVTATDLAGYLVVRWVDGTEDRQTLTPAPIPAASYHDATARAGVTYAYHVLACDTAKPSNCSGPSNVRTVTARVP